MKTYKEFHVYAKPFNPEILSGVLWELDITGINEDDGHLKVFTDNNAISAFDVDKVLEKLKKENLVTEFRTEEHIREYKNWNEEWEKGTRVIKVSDSIVIKPTFREHKAAENETVIIIDPKMSFGTGEHQTTRISLILLQKYTGAGMKILDVGTGTGVLAIAAVKFGAGYALGIDIDEWSVPNFKENARLNGTENKTEVRLCELKEVEQGEFDLVTANIQKNVLIEIRDKIYTHLNKGGTAILSGLLGEDEQDIRRKYAEAGFGFVEMMQLDEWIGLVFKKQ